MSLNQETLSLKEAMEISGVVQKTIWNWCNSGHFKFHRTVNRRLWIDKESFMKYLSKLESEYNKVEKI